MGLRAPGPPVIYSRGSSNAPNEGCIRIITTPCLPDSPSEQKFQIKDPSGVRIKDHIRTLGIGGEATAWAVWEPGLPISFLQGLLQLLLELSFASPGTSLAPYQPEQLKSPLVSPISVQSALQKVPRSLASMYLGHTR